MSELFTPESIDAFAAGYPLRSTRMTHRLVGHPLLTLEALGEAAMRLDPRDLEHNAALDLPMGVAYEDVPRAPLDVHETIRRIGEAGSWVLMKRMQQLPEYDALIQQALAEIDVPMRAATGRPMRPDVYVFVSSAEAITPLHFDPDYNILAQIHGAKTMTLFPEADAELAPQWFKERYYTGGTRNLPWEPRFEGRGVPHRLEPGDALYVPHHAPHHVRVEPGDWSISLSLTWRSEWTHHQADAHRLNKRLRRIGLNPPPPRGYPGSNWMKSTVFQAMAKVETALGRPPAGV